MWIDKRLAWRILHRTPRVLRKIGHAEKMDNFFQQKKANLYLYLYLHSQHTLQETQDHNNHLCAPQSKKKKTQKHKT